MQQWTSFLHLPQQQQLQHSATAPAAHQQHREADEGRELHVGVPPSVPLTVAGPLTAPPLPAVHFQPSLPRHPRRPPSPLRPTPSPTSHPHTPTAFLDLEPGPVRAPPSGSELPALLAGHRPSSPVTATATAGPRRTPGVAVMIKKQPEHITYGASCLELVDCLMPSLGMVLVSPPVGGAGTGAGGARRGAAFMRRAVSGSSSTAGSGARQVRMRATPCCCCSYCCYCHLVLT